MKTVSQKQKFIIAIRIRPNLQEDKTSYKPVEIQRAVIMNNDTSLTIQRKNSQQKTFRFNHIFQDQTQQQIYHNSRHLVDSIFEGHNATFLAYGQTGTGKTHTIFGSKSNDNSLAAKGYFHRAVLHIFSNIKEKMHTRQFAVRVSFVEFYLDNIFDLIQNNGNKLEIKETADDGIHIRDAAEVPVKSAQELFSCVKSAILNRKTEQTSINKRSSRSHAIIQIQILQRWMENNETKYMKGMLKIVDLAGSERVSKTESFGPRLEQAKRINKQITTLGKCINMMALNEKESISSKSNLGSKFNFTKGHIPYRDSKITRYLTDTLDGRAKIMLCVCVSPYFIHLQETFSSLVFATQASTLKVQSKRNQVFSINKSQKKTPRKSIETPIRLKTESKTSFLNDSIQQFEPLVEKKDNEAIKKMLIQIDEIQNYLEGRGFASSKHPRAELESNLISFEKIVSVMRKKFQKQESQRSTSSRYN